MTEHYVTLFDSVFLPQGLALHYSLQEHGGDFLLWVLCLDDSCLQTLQRLNLPQVQLLDLKQLETPELLVVKPGRTRAEYCWTLSPWSIQWVFATDLTVQRVTYLDADVFFLKSPDSIFNEFEKSGCSVLITEHGYAPEYDQTSTSGRYCVQFLPFVRGRGEPILHWWRDRCLEWCFNRCENNLFGDQKYLEHFEHNFPGDVYSTGIDCRFQGPWNSNIFEFTDAVIFHFHGLRILSQGLLSLSNYSLPWIYLENVYKPYCKLLHSLTSQHYLPMISQQRQPPRKDMIKIFIKKWIKKKIFNELQPHFFYKETSVTGSQIWAE